MSILTDDFWLARIEAKKAMIIAIEEAITALAGGAFSYTLNTGQTTQTVTKQNIGSLRLLLSSLENDLASLEARLCGASVRVVPSF
jgi:hypothetical protein